MIFVYTLLSSKEETQVSLATYYPYAVVNNYEKINIRYICLKVGS